MQVVTSEFVKGKKVLLRYDIDVQITNGKVTEDFKLKAGLPTLKLCLENALKVIIIGHLGRPAPPAARFAESRRERGEPFKTVDDEKQGSPQELSAKPIQEWLEEGLGLEVVFAKTLEEAAQSNSKLILLENIRFFHGEVESDIDFAHQLASLGEVYVNEAFSSHNPAASTTMVPVFLPHGAGLHFVKEVEILTKVRNSPKKPFVAIMGGAKVKDKLPVINVLAQKADAVLVGGKLVHELKAGPALPRNVLVGMLNEDGFDIAPQTVDAWSGLISKAAEIVWNGPLGKFEYPKNDATKKIAQMILDCGAEVVIGGGDSVAALGQYGLLVKAEKKAFVSVGGGAMLKFLADGTLPTIEALQ